MKDAYKRADGRSSPTIRHDKFTLPARTFLSHGAIVWVGCCPTGRKIDGRRVVVDVERGRTVKGWRPRRLGGGLGGTRKGSDAVNTKYSGRDEGGDR